MWGRGLCWGILFWIICVPVWGQEVLTLDDGRVIGKKYVSHSSAPYFVVMSNECENKALETLASKFLHLDANVLSVDGGYFSRSSRQEVSADTLIQEVRRCLQTLRAHTEAPFILVGEGVMASASLLVALKDFRVKAVIAVSPGEYFASRNHVRSHLSRNRVPVLVLYCASEQSTIQEMFAEYPRSLYIESGALKRPGYADLVKANKHSGESWLAISIFYREHF